MNNEYRSIRNRTLIVTEGNHEKFRLLKKLLLSFPEIKIDLKNIVIYESNVYNLYEKIVSDYGSDWEEQDIDLPMSVSKWKNYPYELSKENFTNIILIFDYERHDPYFSEEKICKLQNYFSDITDVGQLYLNYPMVESYLDYNEFDYDAFKNKIFKAHVSKGNEYKHQVSKSKLSKIFGTFDKLISILDDEIHDFELSENTIINLLSINDSSDLFTKINSELCSVVCTDKLRTLTYHFKSIIEQLDYLQKGLNYFEYLKLIFINIIHSNIRKANYILGGSFEITNEQLKDIYFDHIELSKILDKQNVVSNDFNTGFVWVLNSSLFIAANYKSFWD